MRPFHGVWTKEPFERFFGQLLFGKDLDHIFVLFTVFDDTSILQPEELWFVPVFSDGGVDRPRWDCSRPQSEIRRIRVGSISGEHRGEDRFVRSPRDLDGQ